MNIKIILITFFVLVITLPVNKDAIAAKVFQWTDEEGVVHFSDMPPGDSSANDTREIHINSFDENDTDSDMYSIINQLDRMEERRRQATEVRLARKRLQIEEKRLAQELELSLLNEEISARDYAPRPVYYAYPGYSRHHAHRHNNFNRQHKKFHSPNHLNRISAGHFGIHSSRLNFGVRF